MVRRVRAGHHQKRSPNQRGAHVASLSNAKITETPATYAKVTRHAIPARQPRGQQSPSLHHPPASASRRRPHERNAAAAAAREKENTARFDTEPAVQPSTRRATI